MDAVIDAQTLTESPTQFEPVEFSSGWLAHLIAHEEQHSRSGRESGQLVEPDLVVAGASPKYMVIQLESGGVTALQDVASLASSFEKVGWLPTYYRLSFFGSAAKSSTTITNRSWRQLHKVRRRNELLRRLTPERRATYERIKKLREEIGPLDFNVVEELRDLRENG